MKKIILLLLLGLTFVFANVGKITAVKGDVSILRAGTTLKALGGFILKKDDKVVTKDNAKALLLFNDNTSITIGKNSTLAVNEFVFDTIKPSNSKTNFGFGKGLFRTITGKIGKINPEGFKIKTKTASIGIRGTDLTTKVESDGSFQVSFTQGSGVVIPDGGVAIPINTGETGLLSSSGQVEVRQGVIPETRSINEDQKELGVEEKSDEPLVNENTNNTKENSQQNIEDDTPAQSFEDDSSNFSSIDNEQSDILLQSSQSVNSNEVINELSEIIENEDNPIQTDLNDIENTINSSDSTTTDSNTTNSTTATTDSTTTTDDSSGIISITPSGTISSITSEDFASATKEILSDDTYMEFGYILSSDQITKTSAYVTGDLTPAATIDQYIQNLTTATYYGTIAGFVDGVASSYGDILLDMDFGNSNFTGSIYFYTDDTYNTAWDATINSGTISSSGFSSTDITAGELSDVTEISGSIDGKFYGPNAESIGGTFKLDGTLNRAPTSASGTFGATEMVGQ